VGAGILNTTSNSAYLSALSVFTEPSHFKKKAFIVLKQKLHTKNDGLENGTARFPFLLPGCFRKEANTTAGSTCAKLSSLRCFIPKRELVQPDRHRCVALYRLLQDNLPLVNDLHLELLPVAAQVYIEARVKGFDVSDIQIIPLRGQLGA